LTKLTTQIVAGLRSLGVDLPDREDFAIERTRAGRHQLAEGCWRWWLRDSDWNEYAGSHETATEVARSARAGRASIARDLAGVTICAHGGKR
jgi:broad specificity phosphatase PhoE